jgi:HAD superfamily hydrolase (TIGR01509 family)
MIKAVIFDMDGLMIDSEPVQSKSYEAVLNEYGKEPEYHDNGLVQVLGVHAGDNWKRLKEKHQISEPLETLLKKKKHAYVELIKDQLIPMPGLIKLLRYLQSQLIVMGVASSADLEQIKFILDKLGISNYFEVVVSGEEVKRGKPYPDVYLEAAKRLKVDPKNCLVLEDAETGVISGKAAGMTVIAVQNQYTINQDHSKADIVTDSLLKINEKMLQSL